MVPSSPASASMKRKGTPCDHDGGGKKPTPSPTTTPSPTAPTTTTTPTPTTFHYLRHKVKEWLLTMNLPAESLHMCLNSTKAELLEKKWARHGNAWLEIQAEQAEIERDLILVWKELDYAQPGLGRKSKPSTKFFSTAGCPFGEGYYGGGYNADAQLTDLGNPAARAQPGLGSKLKPSTKAFSTAGCPFGEGYYGGGYNADAQMTDLGNPAVRAQPGLGSHYGGGYNADAIMTDLGYPAVLVPPVRGPMAPPIPDNHGPSASAVKTRMCNKFNTAEGSQFGDKCHFIHGEMELCKPILPFHDVSMGGAQPMVRMAARIEPPPPAGFGAAASFGASATKEIDASHVSAIIGKGGVNTQHICQVTGAKLAIRDHEADANLRNIVLEGTSDQIMQASVMVDVLIVNTRSAGDTFKTKLCDYFAKGTCKHGDRCHFAHGANELRPSLPN